MNQGENTLWANGGSPFWRDCLPEKRAQSNLKYHLSGGEKEGVKEKEGRHIYNSEDAERRSNMWK